LKSAAYLQKICRNIVNFIMSISDILENAEKTICIYFKQGRFGKNPLMKKQRIRNSDV